ncbi:uncharacterized protein EAE98_011218 [Botrytis deweyae]|uniref:Histidine kinase domain-containing protein n=1 Tax=Botrytis deweyae TaxID=2478750 RepID=A0ABQ7I739_9HELO|nr:uncharacterized protein EAE98_011218 [Botrytis deweyae]KAF7915352.1 hypothetical protein EAE98_011218 [Botrytis deweyae]
MSTQCGSVHSLAVEHVEGNMRRNNNEETTGTESVLAELGAVDLLRQDSRPSFIVDMSIENEICALPVVFTNDAFKTYAKFKNIASWLSGNSCQGGNAFVKWIHTRPSKAVNQYWFRHQRWSKVLLGDRWCVVSGHEMAFSKSVQEDTDANHYKHLQSRPAQNRISTIGNWKPNPNSRCEDRYSIMMSPGSHNSAVAAHAYFTPSLSFETPFAKFFCSKDWSSTAVESISEQLLDMTSLISNFSQLSPIAMFIIDAKDGSLLFANDAWTRITGGTIEEHSNLRWLDCLIDEDREFVAEQWRTLIKEKCPVHFQGRCKTLWRPTVPDPALFGEDEVYYTWGECSAVPRLNDEGDVEHVVGCLSDVTHIKWAARVQERRENEALKEKKEREEFMNMTSHELMNPLSAVVQAAHTMISSLDEINKALSHTHDNVLHDDNSKSYGEIKSKVRRNIAIAKIILACGEHQQKLMEDARMMSKLDINLFSISPTRTEPICIVDTAMSMLSGETSKLDINIRLEVDPSMEALNSQWLCFDPSRFLQLLLNLLTNANKYTKSSETRNVVVRLGATTGSPYHKEIGREIQYIPLRTARNDPTLKDASGTGEIVYLHCSITDTGKGLSEMERQTLFKKFSQKSLSTHTQYGDSSLGLFICRELAELQGGAIGIGYTDSQATGSTFAFYIKTRRSEFKPAGLPLETSEESSQLDGQSSMGDFDVESDTDVISMSELDFSESEMTDAEVLKYRDNGHIHSASFP